MPECEDRREKQNTARCANESASWGGRCRRQRDRPGLPGAVPTCTSPPPGGVGQRPPDGAEKVQLSGIRGISGEQQVTPESASRAAANLPPAHYQLPAGLSPHLSISFAAGLSALSCTPHCLRFPRCLLFYFRQLYVYYVCKSIHPIPAVRVDD